VATISSFYGLQTSLRGLLAQQRALDTAGHNVANANTAGYSRQEAVLTASDAYVIPAGATAGGAGALLGTGVDVLRYRRMRDEFLDLQYRAQATRLGEQSTSAGQLDRVEVALGEPSEDGIAGQLTKFWDTWSDLANAPQDMASRTAVTEQGRTLTDSFKSVMGQLDLVSAQAREEYDRITGAGGEVALYARQIADLNTTIQKFVSARQDPNDLYDRRDQLIDKLAELGRTSVTPTTNGMVEIRFGGMSEPLVSDGVPAKTLDLDDPGGKLGALKQMWDPTGTVAHYREALDTVAANLAEAFRTLQPGFFTVDPDHAAATLTVAAKPALLVTGPAGSGDNTTALAISRLRGEPSIGDTYRATVAEVGTAVRQASSQEANARALADAVDGQRQSVSGVSLDEEMTNLIRFQRGYQASSRAMSTMDEMLDVLINRTGRVGL
jgi:flagellar hook-associated protein 1 FlgK